MHPDVVKETLDAMAADAPAPRGDAETVIARGRRHRAQRRITLVGIAAVLVAVVVTVATVVQSRHTTNVVSRTPTTTVPALGVPAPGVPGDIAVASALEAWKCVDPPQYTNDGGRLWRDIELPAGLWSVGGYCSAIPGGDAWMTGTSPAGNRLVRIRHVTDIQVFALPPVPDNDISYPPQFVDANHGWLSIGPSSGPTTLYRTVDGGATWTIASQTQPLHRVTFENANLGWSISRNAIYTTTDGGSSWHPVSLPAPAHAPGQLVVLFQIVAHNQSIVVWAGIRLTELRSRTFFDVTTDGGPSWTLRNGPAGFEIPGADDNSFAAADATHWELVSGTTFRVTDDGGRTWQNRPKIPGVNGYASAASMISFPTATVGWATNQQGRTWRTTNSGQTWTEITRGLTPNLPSPPPPPHPQTPPALPATGPVQGSLTITASPTGRFTFAPSRLTARTGIYELTLIDGSDAAHTLNFDAPATLWPGLEVTSRGETKTARIFFGGPGDYTFYCALPGHRAAGEQGVVHVSGPTITLNQAEAPARSA